MKFTDKQIDNLFKSIYEGLITVDNLPEDLYFAIANYVKKGLYEGFGGTLADFEFGGTDYELLNELRTNTYMFSGAKTYQQVREFSSFVADSKTFKDFYEQAQKTYEQYNVDWAKAEYNTAIGQAQSAKAWNGFEENKELFPLLRYSAVMDANTSNICRPLNGITRPVDDPFWNVHAPLNHFNCFTGETKILTKNGFVRIDSIVSKLDFVIGGSGKEQQVIGVHVNSFSGEMLQINIKHNSVTTTKNHRFLTVKGWQRAENIKPMDILVQNIEVGVFNKSICAINNTITIVLYLLMSIKRKWKTRMINTFNNCFKIGQKYINKPSINKLVAYCFNANFCKIIKNNLFAFSKWLVKLSVSFGVGFVSFSRFFISFISNINIKHRVAFSHSFSSVGATTTQSRMGVFFASFCKPFTCFNFSFSSINPLRFNRFTALPKLKTIISKQSHKGSTINIPFSTYFTRSKHISKIGIDEGFTNGQPLNSFNSLFSFLLHSFWHRKFVLVKNINVINFTGQIYNLSVNVDESYITNVGVVHNCRCLLEKIDKYEGAKQSSDARIKQAAKEMDAKMDDTFKMNPGKDGYIFSPKHPYFEVAKGDKALARKNFNLPIPEKD
jgi:SPP1 gp7 family putative phage head morphogenesis protein